MALYSDVAVVVDVDYAVVVDGIGAVVDVVVDDAGVVVVVVEDDDAVVVVDVADIDVVVVVVDDAAVDAVYSTSY